jgi:transposase InsO family protein
MRWPWRSLHSTAILPAISSARPQSSFLSLSEVVTDNGKEFLGNFDKTLQEASIKHIWTYPYTPKMNATCERFNRTLREQFIEFNELLLFEDLNLFNQRMAEYLVLYNSKRPHKSLELMTPVDYILRE